MEKENFLDSPSNVLRQEIQDSGDTLTEIGRQTGIDPKCLRRFLEGKQIGSDSFDRLCVYFMYALEPSEVDIESINLCD